MYKRKQGQTRKSSKRFDFRSNVSKKEKLKNAFGAHKDELPEQLLDYIHKNPKRILNRLYKIYGDKAIMYMIKDEI